MTIKLPQGKGLIAIEQLSSYTTDQLDPSFSLSEISRGRMFQIAKERQLAAVYLYESNLFEAPIIFSLTDIV